MEPSLKGQAAVVTGAGGGIGAAVCHKLARDLAALAKPSREARHA